MRIVSASPATPALPISILLLPVLRLAPADEPNAMLFPPVVLLPSAPKPSAVLELPVVLLPVAWLETPNGLDAMPASSGLK